MGLELGAAVLAEVIVTITNAKSNATLKIEDIILDIVSPGILYSLKEYVVNQLEPVNMYYFQNV